MAPLIGAPADEPDRAAQLHQPPRCRNATASRSSTPAVVYEGAPPPAPPGRHSRLHRDDGRALTGGARDVSGAVAGPGIEFSAQEHDAGQLSLALGRAGIAILALTPQLATLEDLFFRLTESDAAGATPTNGATEPAAAAVAAGGGHSGAAVELP
jgi:hypothetical protein